MSEFLTKIAEESIDLADIIVKVAADEVASYSDEEIEQLLSAALESDGIDQEKPEVKADLAKKAESGELLEYLNLKVAEAASEDIWNNFDQEKIASADQGFETAAASKAVGQFLEMNGAAILGSPYGTAPNYFGSVIHSGVDKNVFGGYGKQIITSILKPEAHQATGKISQLLSATNMNNIKTAEDIEKENDAKLAEFMDILEKSANEANQTVDEFAYNIGRDEIEDFIRENVSMTDMLKNEKTASDLVFDYIEKTASELNIDQDRFVIAIGIEKAAAELDAVLAEKLAESEKEAGLGKATAAGAGIGALLGGARGAMKSKGEDGKGKFKSILKGVAGGAAVGAGAGAAGKTVKDGLSIGDKGFKGKMTGIGTAAKMHGESAVSAGKKGFEAVKNKMGKKAEDVTSAVDTKTILELAQERLYGNNA